MKAQSISDRLFRYSTPEPNTGCILWFGRLLPNGEGYGYINIGGRSRSVHRVAYEQARGPIPEGLTIDHLCNVPACINPEHMEAVTMLENIRRKNGRHKEGWFCRQGHPFDVYGRCLPDGSHACRVCQAKNSREYQRRKRIANAVSL